MAILDNSAFQGIADLDLWLKTTSGDSLNLADVPSIIALRWTYFRDNWFLLKPKLLSIAEDTDNPDYFRFSLDQFTTFITQQKYSKQETNPLASADVYFRFYQVFNNMPIQDIDLTNEESDLIAQRTATVLQFSKRNFLDIKSNIRSYRDHLADLGNLSDSTYNGIYDRGTVVPETNSNLADLNLLLTLQKQLNVVDFILANLFAIDTAIDPFILAKANANNPDIKIGQYSSGSLVKINFGEDLPSLAKRFFGDASKWIDIALANGLKEPYIDEVGQELKLLSNGSGSQVNMPAKDVFGISNITKININQIVILQSSTIPFPDQRLVTGVKEVPVSGEIVVSLSGASDLNKFLAADNSTIRLFKPNTINSSQFILIPSPKPLSNPRVDEIPWFLTGAAQDLKQTKVDISVSDTGSLQFTPNGDISLSYGLSNAIQAIKLKLLTEVGSNRYHPNFGLVNVIGTNTQDPTGIKTLLTNSITSQIQADSRFARVEGIDIRLSGPASTAYTINLAVRLAGGSTVVPISFTITT